MEPQVVNAAVNQIVAELARLRNEIAQIRIAIQERK